MNRVKRSSNFELLRIVSMLVIVLNHVAAQAFDRDVILLQNDVFLCIVGYGSRIAVNLFLMTGVWFMVDSEFKGKRVMKLYGSLWFYSVVITLILLFAGQHVGFGDLISSFFPLLRRRMWFVPQYLTLMLISPFLKLLFEQMNKETTRRALIAGFFFISFICTIRGFEDKWLAAFVWFAYVFFVIAYYKRYGFNLKFNKPLCLVGGGLIYLLMAAGLVVCKYSYGRIFELGESIFRQYLGDYKSVPNFLCSLLIFMFFAELDIGQRKWINEISKNTLDVYMIHQQDAFIPVIWVGLFHTKEWQQSPYFILLYLGTVLAVYIGGSLIGRLRVRFVEPLWLKSRLFGWLSQRLDKFYEPVLIESKINK